MTHLSLLHLCESSQMSKKKKMIENVAVVLNKKTSRVCEGVWVQTHQPEPEKESHLCLANSFLFFSTSSHRTPNLRGNKESRLPTGPSACKRIKARPVLTPCASLGKIKPSWGQGQWSCWGVGYMTPPLCTSRRRERGGALKRDQLTLFTASLCRYTFKDGKLEIL